MQSALRRSVNTFTNKGKSDQRQVPSITRDRELAKSYYVSIIKKNSEPNASNAMNNLALMYEWEGKYGHAERYYLMAIKRDHHIAMNNLAMMYEMQHKYDDARKYYQMSILHGNINAKRHFKDMEKKLRK